MQVQHIDEPIHQDKFISYHTNGEQILAINEIEALLNGLKPEQRTVLNLLRQGYAYQEIADKLDLPLGTIKSRIHFSRLILKDKFHQLFNSNQDSRA